MKFNLRALFASALSLFLLGSCAKEESQSLDAYETIALKAWMKLNRPELVDNLQQAGGYYVDVINPGKPDAAPVNDTICWVQFDFSGRDLSGNIVLTRDEDEARLTGTFTKYTHYVPYYRYCGDVNSGNLLEGTYLAMRNKLTLGEKYAADHNLSRELVLREGAEVVLYMPSSVIGNGVVGDGGYQGQYSLDAGRPFIVTMHVQDIVKNPLENEGGAVDTFCKEDGGLVVFDTKDNKRPKDPKDPKHPYNMPEHWTNPVDTIPQLYVNYRYAPDTKLTFPEQRRYQSKYPPYSAFSDLEQKISDALVKRFHKDKPYVGVKELKDSVKLTGTAKIWYIGRFLDGFIFDTNIDEVKKLIYDEVTSKGSVISYKPEDGGMIGAWYYAVQDLKFGQWAAITTTSTYGYGSSGVSGGSSSSSSNSSYYDYYDYNNYYNNYYGNNGYYGGYYGDYYNNYNGGYYDNYYGGYDSSSSSTTTISTEILPYTPLIFQVYVEPKAEE